MLTFYPLLHVLFFKQDIDHEADHVNLRMQKKPYSAVTVQIERLTSEQYEVNDASGVVDLIEVIRLQSSGPTEASRALRKKL